MKPTAEQLAFIRAHGVTACPPAPEIRPFWGYPRHNQGGAYFPTPTEGDLLRAMTLEMQMLARACGKSDVHHLEPEDMAALTTEASAICGIPLAGTRKVFGR